VCDSIHRLCVTQNCLGYRPGSLRRIFLPALIHSPLSSRHPILQQVDCPQGAVRPGFPRVLREFLSTLFRFVLPAVFGQEKFGGPSAWTSRAVCAAPVARGPSVIGGVLLEVWLSFSNRPSVTRGPSACTTRTVHPVTTDCPPGASRSC
jgi:hypothetical protein